MATKKIQFCQQEDAAMTRNSCANPNLEAAIQNVVCAAELVAGPIEAAIAGETASYAFYNLMEEIDALRSAADAAYPAAPAYQPAVTPDWKE